MPSPQEILAGLAETSHRFWYIAVLWHLALSLFLIGLIGGWRPPKSTCATMLVAPLASTTLLAIVSGTHFNAVVFLVMSTSLLVFAAGMGRERVRVGARWRVFGGATMIAFAWLYPHFVDKGSMLAYLYRAPMGLVPCPTLAMIIGIALLFNGFDSFAWSVLVAAVGLFYGSFGVFRLGVGIDMILGMGSLVLLATAFEARHARGVPASGASARG